MSPHRYKRDPEKVRQACAVGEDGSVTALKPTKIIIPEQFVENGLAEIGAQVKVAGIFAHIVDDEYYAVFLGITMLTMEPTAITTVKFDDTSYLELAFDPGARIVTTREVVMDKMLCYRVYDEMISKGHMPWYLSYDDRVSLLFTADALSGMPLLSNHAMLELNAAAISRDPKNINSYYRHAVKSYADMEAHPPTTVALMSVSYGTTNTVSRLMGSYFEQGTDSALANPSTKVENIERLLRS